MATVYKMSAHMMPTHVSILQHAGPRKEHYVIAAEEVSVTQNCSNCSDYNATVPIDAHAHIHMRTRERPYSHVRSLERARMRM